MTSKTYEAYEHVFTNNNGDTVVIKAPEGKNLLIQSENVYGIVSGDASETTFNITYKILDTYWNGTPVISGGDGSLTFSNGAFTVGVDGVYEISYSLGFVASATGIRESAIIINQSLTDLYARNNKLHSITNASYNSGSCTLRLSAGDDIQIVAYQNTGGPLNTDTSSKGFFTIARVG